MDYPVVQYADDTLVIMPACLVQMEIMKEILEKYAQSTGLKINFHKSSLVPINLNQQDVPPLAEFFGCTIASMPFTYLGLPLGPTKPSV